jgi:hypothetical protein
MDPKKSFKAVGNVVGKAVGDVVGAAEGMRFVGMNIGRKWSPRGLDGVRDSDAVLVAVLVPVAAAVVAATVLPTEVDAGSDTLEVSEEEAEAWEAEVGP